MSADLPPPLPPLRVARLLWGAARTRAAARMRRQREIMGRRQQSTGFLRFSYVVAMIGLCLVHGMLGWFTLRCARGGAEPPAVASPRIVVSAEHWHLVEDYLARAREVAARELEFNAVPAPGAADRLRVRAAKQALEEALTRLTVNTKPSRASHATTARQRQLIEHAYAGLGRDGFVRWDRSISGQLGLARGQAVPVIPVLGLIVAGWVAMLICQGEGLELDVQRRRHPVWEWLFSHPVRPAHAFYAELLVPLMANPIYFTAPIFLWVLFGHLFGIGSGLLAALAAGLPLAVATSCVNKAIETAAMLRLGVRSRGAALGIVSWFGYIAMLLPIFLLQSDAITRAFGRFGTWLSPWFPAWPVRALTVGWGEAPGLAGAIVSWWALATLLGVAALWITHRATNHGVQAPTDDLAPKAGALLSARSRLGANPLHRKELLWLVRDKGAVVQVVLIPLTIAATQAFNFRGLYEAASRNWSALCGLAIICGTYFLLVLGPRSLASEGGALWIALTWPRGLEDLLKAKARLWSRVAHAVVGGVLGVACLLFPAAWWKIVLVGCGWLVFGSTLSLKAVSLVTAPSASGEPEPPNRARRWIAMIGTLAFGAGVATGMWHVAIIGIVFSSLVAVAMWQGLRARLPYLFDPWSEQPVPAPSLLHATVGIALLVECVGLITAIAASAGGPSMLWFARALGYGIAGAVGCVVMQRFLARRGVRLGDIVRWPGSAPTLGLSAGLALGVAAGATLAVMATGYLSMLGEIPAAREALDQATRLAGDYRGQTLWVVLLAVIFAPIAEEYFFRGLLYRTLDRELGDWRALVLSAAFFAIFHPPLSWVPVAMMGGVAAWLFRHTRHLAPCVACHMAYNAGLLLVEQIGR